MKLLILLCYCGLTASELLLDTEWWKHATIHEIIVPVFKDSDGVGVGVISKLNHFVDLGIETLYFTPFYESKFRDMGYDIIDYKKVDPRFGTMEDFEQLIKEMAARGMKLIIDLVVKHSSDKHEWFKKSVEKIDPYTDYYIWKDPIYKPGDNKPDNIFLLLFVAWGDFLDILRDLAPLSAPLTYDITTFWLDKGVAGFRMDAPMCYVEDKLFRNGYYRSQIDQK